MKTLKMFLLTGVFVAAASADLGDLNGDGKVNLDDCKQLASMVASGTEADLAIADIDGDGTVTIVDAMRLHQSIGGLWIEPTGEIAPVPEVPQEEREYLAQFEEQCARYEAMSPDNFLNAFAPAEQYVSTLAPEKCTYFREIDSVFSLTADQKALLAKEGMVVLNQPANTESGFGAVYRQIYRSDLPVFFTSDALLDPLYKMYDDALKGIESVYLSKILLEVLTRTGEQLGVMFENETDGSAGKAAIDDARNYLMVAEALLGGRASVVENDVVNGHLDAVAEETLVENYDFFGAKVAIDFSQFKPRGHYECRGASPCDIASYFKCMMWLGRADCALNLDSLNQLRMFAAIHAAMESAEVLNEVKLINDVISFFVGDIDAFSLEGLSDVLSKSAVNAAGVIASDAIAADLRMAISATGGGNQLILSQAMWKDPGDTRPELPVIGQVFGQRFILDSYLLGRTVEWYVEGRNKPLLEEIPFCLGNNTATAVVAPDVHKFTSSTGDYRPYHARLGAARVLFEKYPYWNRNLYTLWLDGLRQLSGPLPVTVPLVMRSRTWQDKQMNTQLASWAQLRHNTLLYAKQSYTGGVSCFYPDGYVEPYPAFYRRIGELVKKLDGLITRIAPNSRYAGFDTESWIMVTDSLASMAELELQGKSLTGQHIAFLNSMFKKNPEMTCGAPELIGWYTKLFYREEDLYKARPCIADVHTIPPSVVKPDNMVLHAATGNASVVIIQAATGNECGTLYAGAVSSFYQHDEQPIKRLADSDWNTMLVGTDKPGVPAWFKKYIK